MSEEFVNFRFDKKPGSIIKVIGVGGGGGNAVNHMYEMGIHDVDFIICNTDSQALTASPIPVKVQLGSSLTEGRGAGNKPETGKQAAIENLDDVKISLHDNTKMVFITAGMGGGTGTGGAPVIAELCRDLGFLTVGIVTIPFRNEGKRRIKQAIDGIREMEQYVDSLLIINNERIREMYGDFPISQAFARADDVLAIAAKGIAEIITVHGYINVDFADVETVMRQSGVAIMGTGLAEGEGRAVAAIEKALASPLLNNNNINGARNILLNVTSGNVEVTMDEIGEITDYIQTKAGYEADLIWGNGYDENLEDQISVTIIATGFSTSSIPALLANQKPEKVEHRLNDTAPASRSRFATPSPVKENPAQAPGKQTSFQFDINSHHPHKSEYDILYPETAKEKQTVKQDPRQKIDYSGMTDDDVDNLENVPAYIRKQKQSGYSSGLNRHEYSELSVKPGTDKKVVISGNNLYIHKNVD